MKITRQELIKQRNGMSSALYQIRTLNDLSCWQVRYGAFKYYYSHLIMC